MANYYGTARSNYFRVKDGRKFEEEMAKYPVEVITKTKDLPSGDPITLYGLLGSEEYGWPSQHFDEETNDIVEYELIDIVSKHLAKDSVAIFMEVGAEKMRYLNGYAIAINSKGQTKTVSIDDIYQLAEKLGTVESTATY